MNPNSYGRIENRHVRWGAGAVQRLDPEGVRTVIDAGCGTGQVTALLLEHLPNASVIALDNSRQMLAEAAQRLSIAVATGRIELVHADLNERLPFDLPVDAILSTATFHWIADHERLFNNLARVLAPGGQLVAQCGGAGQSWCGGTHFATVEDTQLRLQSAGFVDIEVWLDKLPVDPKVDYVRLNIVARRSADLFA